MFGGLSSHAGDRPISFEENASVGLRYFSRNSQLALVPPKERWPHLVAYVPTDRLCAACGVPLGTVRLMGRVRRYCSRFCWSRSGPSAVLPMDPEWRRYASRRYREGHVAMPGPPPVLNIITASPRDVDGHWPAFSARVHPRVSRPGTRVVRVVLAVGPSPPVALKGAVGSSVHAFSPEGAALQALPKPAKGVVRVAVLWTRHQMEICCTAYPSDALEHWKL